MRRRNNRQAIWLFALLTLIGSFTASPFTPSAMAQDADDESVTLDRPLVVFNLASKDALFNELSYVFDSIERPDVMDGIKSFIDENLRGLKGVSQDQPIGAMLFLRSGFPPQIEPIIYIPIDDIDEATKTVEARDAILKEGENGLYKVISARSVRHLKIQDDYAYIFVGDEEKAEEVLDRTFPNPAKITKRMSKQYDFCVSLDMTSVPKGMKQLAMGFLKAQTSTELQQRDDEPDGVYQIRRAQGDRMLEGLDLMMKHGERLELGIDASSEERHVAVELQIDARKDSPLAKSLDDMNSKRSHFARLLQEDAAFSFSTSAKYDDFERDSYLKMLDGLEMEIMAKIEEDRPDMDPKPVSDIIRSLRETVKMQHMDMFIQCYGQPPELKVVGAFRVKGGDSMANGLTYFFNEFKDDADFQTVEMNYDTHQNIAFHRANSPDGRGEAVLGANPAVHLGMSSRTIWFAIGGDGAMDQLKEVMDTLLVPAEGPRKTERPPAVRMVFNARQWMGLAKKADIDEGEEDQNKVRRAAFRNARVDAFQSAFENGDDRLQFDISPSESGGRFRLQLDEGFVRYFAGMAAQGFDWRNQRRGQNGDGERRGRPRNDE